MVKSVYENQHELLKAIMELYAPDGFDCDITFGNGGFYKEIERPKAKFDIEPLASDVIRADSRNLPIPDNTMRNIVFDPPFLTYIKSGREHGSIMGKRFGGYWAYDELEEHYKSTIEECARVLKNKGLLIFKCQDIIHNHKMHCTHYNVINWASEHNLILKDIFILVAKSRMPIKAAHHGNQRQKHARIYHSYFLILEKKLIK